MISDEQYHRLTVKSHQPKSIVQLLHQSPLGCVTLDLERDKDTGRDVELRAASCWTQIGFPSLSAPNPNRAWWNGGHGRRALALLERADARRNP